MGNDFLEPWRAVTDRECDLAEQLRRELPSEHPFHQRKLIAIALRQDSGDVLFRVGGDLNGRSLAFVDSSGAPPKVASSSNLFGEPEPIFVVVRLARRGRPRADDPSPEFPCFKSLEQWKERCMRLDHEQFVRDASIESSKDGEHRLLCVEVADDDGPVSPEEIAHVLAGMGELLPLEFPDEVAVDLDAWERSVNQYGIDQFDKSKDAN